MWTWTSFWTQIIVVPQTYKIILWIHLTASTKNEHNLKKYAFSKRHQGFETCES